MLVDDHVAFREALVLIFGLDPEFEVVAEAGSVAEARRALRENAVDLAVLDLDLPDGSGTDLIEDLRAENPDSMALILTASEERGTHARAVEAGAAGVLHESVRLGDITKPAKRLAAGETLLSTNEVIELLNLAGRQREQDRESRLIIESLTPRERDTLQALAEGLNDKEIAQRLYLGVGTVRGYVTNTLAKLGVHSRTQALIFAVRHNLVDIG